MLATGMIMGALVLKTLDGSEFVMDNYDSRRGTLIVFMSSRSPALEDSMGDLLRVHEKYRRQDVLYVGLFPNDDEKEPEIKAFCLRHEANFPVYRDPGGAIARRLGVERVPQAFLLDPGGVVRYQGGFHGPGASADMEATIAAFLEGKPLPHADFKVDGTPLAALTEPASTEDPVQPLVFASALVFPKVPWAVDHHCSTITETPNGDLLCLWYGGSFECADNQRLFMARRKSGEGRWGEPEALSCGSYLHPPGNAIIFRVSPSRTMIFWDRMDEKRPIRSGRWGAGQLMERHSDDNGYTWSEDRELNLGAGGLRNVPTRLETGELLVPVSGPGPGFLVTRDFGQTWALSGAIGSGGQPTVAQRGDGSLLCFLRNKPNILQSESNDLGKTWTPAKPNQFDCPGASMALCRLDNGHLALIFNDSPTVRYPISVVYSEDDGVTWSRPVALESNPGEYAYPSMIQGSDGTIHVTYTFLRKTIKHVEFNERWLKTMASGG